MIMLVFLLFNAGHGTQASELKNLFRKPKILCVGLLANLLIPIGFVFLISKLLGFYHDVEEAQHVLLGLALVVSMPIAGSSTAWAQNANGNLTLSLGLVLFSTILSPFTTPVTFELIKHMATGEYVHILDQLKSSGRSFLLIGCVLAPSLLGIAVRFLLSERVAAGISPFLKLCNSLNLLMLNYSNAGVSLPNVFTHPDPDLIAMIIGIVFVLCLVTFGSGWFLARLLKADSVQKVSLMFGLGMNNNGTSLVLASLTLSRYPRVLLPIVFYNLTQHLVAGIIDKRISRKIQKETRRD